MGCLTKCGLQRPVPDSTPKNIFVVPSADPAAPKGAVRVNRSILRKLRRLERLKPEVFLEKDDPLPDFVKTFSPLQFLDYMIRTQNWVRVKMFGLGETLGERGLRRARALGLQGDWASLNMAAPCNAILAPD